MRRDAVLGRTSTVGGRSVDFGGRFDCDLLLAACAGGCGAGRAPPGGERGPRGKQEEGGSSQPRRKKSNNKQRAKNQHQWWLGPWHVPVCRFLIENKVILFGSTSFVYRSQHNYGTVPLECMRLHVERISTNSAPKSHPTQGSAGIFTDYADVHFPYYPIAAFLVEWNVLR